MSASKVDEILQKARLKPHKADQDPAVFLVSVFSRTFILVGRSAAL